MRRVLVVAAVVVLGAWGWTAYGRAQNQDALSAVAGDLAGKPVRVGCQSWFGELLDISGNLGDVPFENGRPAAHTHLVHGVCGELERFRESTSHPQLDCLQTIDWRGWSYERDRDSACARRARPTTEAINTLAHESMHMRGWTSESTAQCYAIQADAVTTEELGGTAEEGRAVAAFVLAMQPGLPDEYQSRACGPGGALDLHPETPAFPSEG